MTFNIFRFVWLLIHVIYSSINFIVVIWVTVRKKLEELLSKDSMKDELEFIAHHIKLLVKVPSHLVLIIGNEEIISFDDLANITVWCIAAGISFVSFYDHDGVLKRCEPNLVKALCRIGKEQLKHVKFGNSTATNGYAQRNGNNLNGSVSGGTNGYVAPKLTVNIFSSGDGRGGLVEVTNNLCQAVLSGQMDPSVVSQEVIDNMLYRKLGLPEPELALYCGTVLCTYGVLPWHIRVTEFLQMQTHHNVKARDFINLLYTFGDRKQRFGK